MKICTIYNYAQHYRTSIFLLIDQEFDCDFVFGDSMGDVKKMDYRLFKNEVTEVKNRKWGTIEWQKGVLSLALKKYDAYILLAGPMVLSTWIFAIIARILHKKVIFWSHGWYGKETTVQKIIKKIFFRLPNYSLVYGNYARNIMIEEGLSSNKIGVIHNSLLYDDQLKIRDSLRSSKVYFEHFKNDFPVLIFVGRLTAVKRLDLLLEAISLNKKKGRNYNVVFVGEGTEKERLQGIVSELFLSRNVWFYGASYKEEELSQLIYDADLCVAPGNIGLTAMHAMVYGCPCISHNDFKWQMPEFEAIIPDKTGMFFLRDDVNDLAIVISNWFQRHANDRERVRQYCYDEIDKRWNPHEQIKIIKKLIYNE